VQAPLCERQLVHGSTSERQAKKQFLESLSPPLLLCGSWIMFKREQYATAIRVHERVYAFIAWLRGARRRSALCFDERHVAMNEFDAARRWLDRNRAVIPPEVFPDDREKDAFVNMLVSFGMTSRGAVASERHRGAAFNPPVATCTCRFCGDLIWRLGQRTLHVRMRSDARGARMLKLAALRRMAATLALPLGEADLEAFLARRTDATDRELAIVAYADELVRRCGFDENRLAYSHLARGVLVLWYEIARGANGRVPRGFRLEVQRILRAQSRLAARLKRVVASVLTE